jgi:hypothetical protein
LNKAPSTDAYIRVANSVAFWNAARSVVLITADGDGDLRLVAQRKANYARMRPVERHRIDEVILPEMLDPATGEPIVTARMVFVEYADDVDGVNLLGPQKTTKVESAETLLRALLMDGDWHESAEIKQQMEAAGHSERTTQRAAKFLGVENERTETTPSRTLWRISLGGTTGGLDAPDLVAPLTVSKSGATGETARTSGSKSSLAPVAPTRQGISLPSGNGAPLCLICDLRPVAEGSLRCRECRTSA